jgi:PAS domain S-box-containing protein
MRQSNFRDFLGEVHQLPSLPPVAARLIQVASDRESSMREVTSLIESDAGLTAKVLQIANSAYFGFPRQIETVERATALLGLDLVRSLALSIFVIDMFRVEEGQYFNPLEFWRHSMACAVASELLARRRGYRRPQEIFIAGLLHDIGKLLMFCWNRDVYEEMVVAARVRRLPLHEVEKQVLGLDHAEAATLLMEHWKFPPALVQSSCLHHRPASEFGADPVGKQSIIVKCANSLCHLHRFGESGNSVRDLPMEQLLSLSGLTSSELERLSADVLRRFEEVSDYFDWVGCTPDLYLSAVARANRELSELCVELEARNREREAAEERLRHTRELMEAMIDASPLAIVATDSSDKVLIWNPAAERIFGWTRTELEGKLPPFPPSAERNGDAMTIERFLSDEPASNLEATIIRKDGLPIKALISKAPIPEGNSTGLMALIADQSERKSLEEQLYQAQKMEAVGRLAGGIAHDFNNLLTAITGYGYLLRKSMPDDCDALNNVKQIESAAERASKLTRQLLAFSRRQSLEPAILDLNPLVEGMTGMLQRMIGEDVVVALDLAPDLDHVKVDSCQIEQVLLNLVLNARDAMPSGGKVVISTSEATVGAHGLKIEDAAPGKYVVLTVEDNGCGMEDALLRQIFDPFFTTKEVGQGTGLGLSTVYGIVKHHKGHIDVQSKLGSGTVFKIFLPAHSHNGDGRKTEKTRAVLMPDVNRSILLVEDEEVVKELLQRVLSEQGYQVLCAADPKIAEQLFLEHREEVSLLLTDVILPEQTGVDLHRSLTKQKPDLKVLYMSGYNQSAIADRLQLENEISFIQKPFVPGELIAKVSRILGHA